MLWIRVRTWTVVGNLVLCYEPNEPGKCLRGLSSLQDEVTGLPGVGDQGTNCRFRYGDWYDLAVCRARPSL